MSKSSQLPLIGKCYCGAVSFTISRMPNIVSYCHCEDCRRISGAPVAALAAFNEIDVEFTSSEGKRASINDGVSRSFCDKCGSPTAARFDYLPEQIYIPIGLFNRADLLEPELHSHAVKKLPWLKLEDSCPKFDHTSRSALNESAGLDQGFVGEELDRCN